MLIEYSDRNFRFNHTSRTVNTVSFAAHSHEGFEIIYMIKCNATYLIDGKEYTLKPGDAILTRPFSIHTLNVEPKSEYERFNIIFGENAIPLSILKKIPPSINVINFEGNKNVSSIFEKGEYYLSVLDKEDIPQVLTGLITELLLNIIIQSKNEPKNNTEFINPIVYKSIDYIENNLRSISEIEEIANELFITKSHLHHIFMKYMNTSPKKYITTRRLALAQKEILSGCKPTEVYLRCGFSDYSSFYRAYCKYFGRTPSDKSSSDQGAKLKL